ncbi:formate dehydrogenase accessory sulfurtransferase FdhD [Desmospora profundinema]|uniref:Sulfur carrier protein FdhD n=1 Tax=Desmospora profundinema TaxID=1571184 RepID=A0ABU1IRZ3_9BACL|nr:formate dehydrogenase accessory sulfurtransferase FdhD [Desmospora profundinema]MDR6227562.1 FdhD protein [Desmospora profundinema]
MHTTPLFSSSSRRRIEEVHPDFRKHRMDEVTVEEPLEIRLLPSQAPEAVPLAVTMRTPGHDYELAAGFLWTEGILENPAQIHRIYYCRNPREPQYFNIVQVALQQDVAMDWKRFTRHFYQTSSCGICGKASLEAIRVRGVAPVKRTFQISPSVIRSLPEALRREQTAFDRTGGLHAAAWFDCEGSLLALREDVGRHNAVDKLLGSLFLSGAPLHDGILMVSGRASFEIMQKAAVAGVAMVAAVSAPSSLACDLAREFGITLIGFMRKDRFNIYTGGERVEEER